MNKPKNISVLSNSFVSTLKRYKATLFLFLKVRKDTIKANTASASQLIPGVVRKPSVIWRWLLSSHWFYISIIVTVILMKTAIPSAVDTTLHKIYPQIETKRLFGLIVEKTDDSRIIWQRKIILGLFWAGACGLNAYALLLCLPGAVRKANLKAHQIQDKADTMVAVKPSESILLYTKALKLTADPAYESILISKIDTLDNYIKTGKIKQAPTTLPEAHTPQEAGTVALPRETGTVALPKTTGTVVMPKDDASNSGQEDTLGPDGRYHIERKLGRGAMGVVFLAKDQLLFRDVALKRLTHGSNQDQEVITRFQQEARALAQLSHPNIVQIYDFIQDEDQNWIAMEYVAGKDLESLLETFGKYSVEESLRLCSLIAEAMDYAHNRGVVHRDFKPSNVLITADGDPKVMDFGLAKLSHSSFATMAGSLLGSPAFMSPEQARGENADARSDIYAMGVTLYQLVTGKLPFEGDLKTILTQKITGHQPDFQLLENQMPADLAQFIRNMMAFNPDDRPATMQAVGQALKSISKTHA